jgi:transaldolase
MKFFIDTAVVEEIREVHSWGVLSGVTTNPSLVVASGRNFHEVIKEIAQLVGGSISAEVTALETKEMVAQGKVLAALHPAVVVKVPLTPAGLGACAALRAEGIRVNVTLCFSVNQAMLAARAGASYISPFVGRIDDINGNGIELVREIAEVYALHDIETEVLAASLRHPRHVTEAALAGAQVSTLPYKVFKQMISHPLTDKGLDQFMQDWAKGSSKQAK